MKGKAKMDFQNSNPSYWSALLQNPEAIPHLKAHDTRVQGIKARLAEHIQANRMQWVADEADRLWRERGKPKLTHPVPKWAGRQPHETWLEQAKRNVHRRIEERFARLFDIDEQMCKEIIHRPKTQDIQPVLLVEAKARRARNHTAASYRNHRAETSYVTEPQENLGDRRDNETRLSERLNRIEREKSNMLSQLETPQSEPARKEPKPGIKHSFGQEM
jgi:hypothetical protein